jgi:dihydrofolate reductase
MAHGLIDEYRLCVYPVLVGSGARLFEDPKQVAALRLTDIVSTASGVVAHTYVPEGPLRHSSFDVAEEPEGHRVLR